MSNKAPHHTSSKGDKRSSHHNQHLRQGTPAGGHSHHLPGAHHHSHTHGHPAKPILQHSLLLLMEAKSRIQIWKRMSMDTLRALRLTCHRIKSEIDHNVGIAFCVDDTKPFHAIANRVGIQHLRIRKLTSDHFHRFLLHPFLLRKLEIVGDISPAYATYIFESCPHIRFLLIHFGHNMLHHRHHLFPVRAPYHGANVGAFPEVTHLHVESSTASNADFMHMRDLLYAVLTLDLKHARMREFHVHVTHDATSRHLNSFNSYLAVFVNNNAATLDDLTVDIICRQMKLGHSSLREILESNSTMAQSSVRKSQEGNSRHTKSTGEHSKGSSTTSTEAHELNYVGEVLSWNEFPNLKKVHINVNKFAYYWVPALTRANALESLYLNLKLAENWDCYIATVKGSASTLSSIQLHTVNRGNWNDVDPPHDDDLRIDLSIFRRCPKLTRLGILCKEDEVVGTNYRLTSIRSVFHVGRLDFAWVHVTPCQLTQLLTFSSSLHHLDLRYCTVTNWELGAYFCRWRWLMGLKCKRLSVMAVIDNKLRFQENMKSVNRFLESQWRHTAYYDGFYIKVVYSKAIRNKSKGTQKRFAFQHNKSEQDTKETVKEEGGEGEDEKESE